jgi:hypothetical protein
MCVVNESWVFDRVSGWWGTCQRLEPGTCLTFQIFRLHLKLSESESTIIIYAFKLADTKGYARTTLSDMLQLHLAFFGDGVYMCHQRVYANITHSLSGRTIQSSQPWRGTGQVTPPQPICLRNEQHRNYRNEMMIINEHIMYICCFHPVHKDAKHVWGALPEKAELTKKGTWRRIPLRIAIRTRTVQESCTVCCRL